MPDKHYDFCCRKTSENRGQRIEDREQRTKNRSPKLLLLFCISAAMLAGLTASPLRAQPPLTFLHTRGQDIVDDSDKKVFLRGVGLGNWLLPEGYMWKFGDGGDRPRRIEHIVADLIGPDQAKWFWTEYRSNYITESDIQRIAELGYNSVRPALNSRLFLSETEPPQRVEEGFILLDHLVAWCKAHGVYVILDMHAAPGGQTGQNIDDSANDQPELFQQAKFQERLVELWKQIARRYKEEPTVAGYDLLNEPLPERTGAAKAHKTKLEPLYRRLTRAIREIDSRHMIIVEGADWANDWSVFSKPFDKNLVYQFHYYCWDDPATLKDVQKYLDYRNRFNAPVWVGETGERDDALYWATTEYFEANNIGWSFWPWKKMDTQNTPYSIKPPASWNQVAAYSRNGHKPSPELSREALDQFLRNIRLENCVFFPDVVNSMLRLAPGRIQAENFGHDGAGKSYQVKDPARRSAFYRPSEPVPVSTSKTTGRRQSSQYITLSATEWTAYAITSRTPKSYDVSLRAKAGSASAEIQLTIGEHTRCITLSSKGWSDINIGTFALLQGPNRIKLEVKSGTADLDWLDVNPAKQSQQSAGVEPATRVR
ncbi:MAG: glycoside hydrolase [Verrucomicrobia bacterium]|nr:MAG: glycoside hydrolase [Verrucomicrobiota bacterium]